MTEDGKSHWVAWQLEVGRAGEEAPAEGRGLGQNIEICLSVVPTASYPSGQIHTDASQNLIQNKH